MLLRVSIRFAKLSDAELGDFTHGVVEGMTDNTAYPAPPVTVANLETARNDFTAKLAATRLGGPGETSTKNEAREKLLGMLRLLAGYVQITCNNDLATLLSSGFEATSTNRTQVPLDRPLGLIIRNGTSGLLTASVNAVKNVNSYEGRAKAPSGDWLPSVFSSDSKHIIFEGLTPGTVYTIQVRALGGSTGNSDWSDPSSHMAT